MKEKRNGNHVTLIPEDGKDTVFLSSTGVVNIMDTYKVVVGETVSWHLLPGEKGPFKNFRRTDAPPFFERAESE